MNEALLSRADDYIYNFLKEHVEIMPMRFVKIVAFYYTDARVRKLYLERLGVAMGENTFANLGFRIVSDDYEQHVRIGKNVSIAPNVTLVVSSSANNGDIINTCHYVTDCLTKTADIVIDDDAWIGANVTILPGISIGTCAVIGAGSVVTRDVAPYTVVAGVPARPIRTLEKKAKGGFYDG